MLQLAFAGPPQTAPSVRPDQFAELFTTAIFESTVSNLLTLID